MFDFDLDRRPHEPALPDWVLREAEALRAAHPQDQRSPHDTAQIVALLRTWNYSY